MVPVTEVRPHEPRKRHDGLLGRLKYGNLPGDPRSAPRCSAKTRRGTRCQCPAMRNGRCRLHGGLSTGPKTPEGIERIRRAVTKHGRYSRAATAERRFVRQLIGQSREHLVRVEGLPRLKNAQPQRT